MPQEQKQNVILGIVFGFGIAIALCLGLYLIAGTMDVASFLKIGLGFVILGAMLGFAKRPKADPDAAQSKRKK